MITKVTSPKTPSTKNLYGKAGWMKVRFDDLMRIIEKKKRISKVGLNKKSVLLWKGLDWLTKRQTLLNIYSLGAYMPLAG